MIEPKLGPRELFGQICEESGGNLGGTIRDGSDSEKFSLGSLTFNIHTARDIAGSESNSEVEVSADWSEAINVSPSHALRGGSDRPVFIALLPLEEGNVPLLIDGHHRMYRAVNEGEETLEAYTFTPEQVLTFLEAPPNVMMFMNSNLRNQKEKLQKGGPTGSDVHVRTTDWKKAGLRVLEGGGLNGLDAGTNSMDGVYSMAQIVSGVDWERSEHGSGLVDYDDAKNLALENLSNDPDFYRKKRLMAANEPERTMKDTEEGELPDDVGTGINIDLGSGQAREPGYVGVDLYPYDEGTVVDDMENGLEWLDDESVENVRMSNVPEVDPKILLSTVQRVLMPGGQFVYEGPSEIYNYPPYMQLVSQEAVTRKDAGPWNRTTLRRLAIPDAATSNDAEPRIGIAQYDALPADALLAMDAAGYAAADMSTSGRGNRLHGYPSQGALLNKGKILPPRVVDLGTDNTGAVSKGGPGSGRHPGSGSKPSPSSRRSGFSSEGRTINVGDRVQSPHGVGRVTYRQASQVGVEHENGHKGVYHSSALTHVIGKCDEVSKEWLCPIVKADKWKRIVYCVVLSPDEADLQDDIMSAEDIEKTAHDYLIDARNVGAQHSRQMDANVVESYIAPVTFNADGQYGPQQVNKGAWVIGIKVQDEREWQKVLNGEYTGVSVGGMGSRTPITDRRVVMHGTGGGYGG